MERAGKDGGSLCATGRIGGRFAETLGGFKRLFIDHRPTAAFHRISLRTRAGSSAPPMRAVNHERRLAVRPNHHIPLDQGEQSEFGPDDDRPTGVTG
jgi:hypothetical protein